jgi:hypothetical protein
MSSRSLRDRLLEFGNVGALRPLMVGNVDYVQDLPPAMQLLVPMLTAFCLAKGAGIEPRDVLTQIEKMARAVDGPFANQWAAMVAYAKGELNG